MEKIIACFCKSKNVVVFEVINICVKKKCFIFPFALFMSICRMNCYVICLLSYSCHFIQWEAYISNITSFPALSVLMFTNVRILLLSV